MEESILLHVVVSAILFTTTVCSGSDWPSGWYGLPQPKARCPSSSEWGSGWWYEDRRLNNQSTAREPKYSQLKGTFTQAITKRYFCIKKRDNRLNIPWPNGQYCIYQRPLQPCPPRFVRGSIGWKNNKDIPNNNHHSDNLNIPSGVFASSTRINYCCKVDGSKQNSISLPIYRPFFLLAYGSSECQSVKWATTTQEYLRFSVQEQMTYRGFHPFVDDNNALRYCYYQGSNKTLTTPQGTISRYLNQTSVHQERYTAWHINPVAFQFLVLRFTRFTFHASNINSYLEVLDGRSESAPSLGRFSSTQSPLGQSITSSTNQLFVVLHFGDRSGTYDFEFNYHIYSPKGSVWPSGWYGLPQPKAGCPSSSDWWDNGWWYEDRRLNDQSTARVSQYSHLKGNFTQAITKRFFCIKKRDNGLNIPWPNGQYCIYQRLLKPCPSGFVKGSIGWKNKDAPNNNHHSINMNIPSGVFASSTRINYCCKVDGLKENSISLPINRPFFLLAYGSSECQSVKWATTTQEYLRFSVQEKMRFRGFHPFVDDNYALRYCYYQRSNKTLTTPQGTISGYLNQTSVHQERYTAWHINPVAFQFLVLRFTRFTFHASNISSYLEVLDGRNESAPSLGRFSSTQSPLGQSITSTNQLFVILHFGDRSGTYDFEFNYHIYSPTVSTTAEIKTPTSTKNTSSLPYTSSSKVTSLPSTTHVTGTHLHSHGNGMLLLYTLLPTGGLVVIIVIIIGVMIVRRKRKRIAYSRLTSLSIDEIVSELNDTSCAVTSDKHRAETGMTARTRLKLMDTTSDSDDEMINLDRNPPDFPSTVLQSL